MSTVREQGREWIEKGGTGWCAPMFIKYVPVICKGKLGLQSLSTVVPFVGVKVMENGFFLRPFYLKDIFFCANKVTFLQH